MSITSEDPSLEEAEDEHQDPELMGLDEDEKKWRICKMGFDQITDFCKECGCPYAWEMFITNGYYCADDIRFVTEFNLINHFGMTDGDDREACLQRSVHIIKDDHLFRFKQRYGDPKQLLPDCTKGRQFIADNPVMFAPKDETKAENREVSGTYDEKWGITPEDYGKFNRDGIWCMASGCDGMVFAWNFDDPSDHPPCVRVLPSHMGICCDFFMDWKRMYSISVGGDCRAVLYDVERKKQVSTVKNNTGMDVSQAWICIDGCLDAGKLAVGSNGGHVKIGDVERGKVAMVMKGHDHHVYGIKADWDLNQVVSCSWDHCVNIYDIRSGKRTKRLHAHQTICNRIDVDFERQLAVSVGADCPFHLWDLQSGEIIKSYEGHPHGNNDVAVNFEKMLAVTGGEDGDVIVWDLETGERKLIFNIEWDVPEGQESGGSTWKLYENEQSFGKRGKPDFWDQTLAVDVNWEEGIIMTGSWDRHVRCWDLHTGKCLKVLNKARRVLTQVVIKQSRDASVLDPPPDDELDT